MADYSEKDLAVFEGLKAFCLERFANAPTVNVSALALGMMQREDVPMHYPFHHYIVPAALLTATAAAKGDSRERLEDMLSAAMERAKLVVGGSCGNMGACGAAVGAGIYMSVYTDSSPMSTKTWSWANELTGRCLQALSGVEGPRCCKRTAFMVIREAVPYANAKLGTGLCCEENPVCTFYEQNRECKRRACPFYPQG